jgi:hypothetical protein
MSTTIVGEQDVIFAAVEEVFRRAAARGDVVMHVAFSNACPVPRTAETERGC